MSPKDDPMPTSQPDWNENLRTREYFTLWLTELEKRINEKFESIDRARELAANNIELRLEKLNEFRDTMRDRDKAYFTRIEHEIYMKSVDSDLRELRSARDEMRGKASQSSVNIALVISGLAAAVSIIKIIIDLMSIK
jgi:hypothetical protein